MKKQVTSNYMSVLVILFITVLLVFPVTLASEVTAQAQTKVFIDNVLPVDFSQYNVTLKNHSQYGTSDMIRYTLESDESNLRLFFEFENNVLRYCNINTEKGQVISDKQHDNMIDAVKSFLEKYQTYTKIDSTNLIDMLDKIDLTQNSTITNGNTELTVCTYNNLGTELTLFKWAYIVNGAEYNSLQVGFQTKTMVFDVLLDTRALYSVGDTTVNVSSEQAIDLAVKHSAEYSYAMPDGSQVSGFNITKEKTTTELLTTALNTTELRPYWMVRMYLNQTYPGSVIGLTVFIWANNGEVFDCSNIAVGGAYDSSITQTSTPSPASSTNDAIPIIITATATIIAITALIVVIKKRRK
ncbi:MAG: hypothetical protein QCH99_11070 [Candidatus Bathyarchaeota archaeon]|nr:hypothetical protein [Candidatus Bathyarchaeum tardum]